MVWSAPRQSGPPDPYWDRHVDDVLLKHDLFWKARPDSAGAYTSCGVAGIIGGAGTTAAVVDAAGEWMSCTSVAGDGNGFGRNLVQGMCRIGHKPHAFMRFRLGADITTTALWVGINDPAVMPTKSAAYVGSHVCMRYIAGTDTGWVLDSADGAVQWTDTSNFYAISANQDMWLEFDMRETGLCLVTLRDSNGAALASKGVTSRLPASTTLLGLISTGFNIGGGFTRVNYWGKYEIKFK